MQCLQWFCYHHVIAHPQSYYPLHQIAWPPHLLGLPYMATAHQAIFLVTKTLRINSLLKIDEVGYSMYFFAKLTISLIAFISLILVKSCNFFNIQVTYF